MENLTNGMIENEYKLEDILDDTYKPGQIWKYKNRESEPRSTFTILKTEHNKKLGVIIHIRLNDVRIPHAAIPEGMLTTLPHFPFAKRAILDSTTELVSEGNEIPSFKEGYNIWRREFQKGHAGIFTIGIADVVQINHDAAQKFNK